MPADTYATSTTMPTYSVVVQGSKLTEVINQQHENPKYLPGISLGKNTIADPDLESTVSCCLAFAQRHKHA